MKHKAVKIALTSLVLAVAFGGLLYPTMGEATEYYKHVDEVMAQPGASGTARRLQLHGFAKQVTRKPSSLEYRFQVESNGEVGDRHLQGRRPGHVQGRRGSRVEGHVDARRLHGCPERRDGEVPVEVRTAGCERLEAIVTGPDVSRP